ncbi:hypothetical protein HH213_27965 [Duganella dendranthematis]|jgi:hypothetical protein|uniref:C-type lysozyme inhibitor domain-containing protein n=1 Tax=Duganella dendranthematis TaxID=2728021 RepID=A0ABX6MGW5_9BURK|nr:hypothetical protein [Duganella dendranthematis]QJD93581.1 hypothetical protein HH213_27965 [Duganella dendranthematis]
MKTSLLMMLTIWAGAASAAPQTLCRPQEQVFFSCSLGKKIVSVCMTPDKAAVPYMEYRFGTAKNIELKYRSDARQPKFSRVAVNYASNAETVLWFRNADTDYLLHFPMKGGPGLEVKQQGKTISEMACQGGWAATVGEHDQPLPFISEQPDIDSSEAQHYWQR